MLARRMAIFALIFATLSVSAFAQLGPKDGADFAPTDLNRVRVGQPAPDFTLEDVEGKAVTLSSFQSKKSVVLVFYRGYW
jgi:cytochrome oxidase Cu insertion factor (SCO1/SenC/PrrC family)